MNSFRKYAINDKEKALDGTGLGNYYCYCKQEFTLINYIKKKDDDLCHEYNTLYIESKLYSNSITYGLTFIEIIMKKINHTMVSSLGHTTKSKETREMMLLTFIT